MDQKGDEIFMPTDGCKRKVAVESRPWKAGVGQAIAADIGFAEESPGSFGQGAR